MGNAHLHRLVQQQAFARRDRDAAASRIRGHLLPSGRHSPPGRVPNNRVSMKVGAVHGLGCGCTCVALALLKPGAAPASTTADDATPSARAPAAAMAMVGRLMATTPLPCLRCIARAHPDYCRVLPSSTKTLRTITRRRSLPLGH